MNPVANDQLCRQPSTLSPGKLLAELDNLGLADTTLVAVMGDHGWQLGEMNLWRKMTNFELGVRVPLIIRTPWLPSSVGVRMHALVEAVDLFPTFLALTGAPQLPAEQVLQGISLAPHGARFLTGIYARGCHWFPRMFV
jgi:iduronate 2-sulfatase